MNLHRFARAFGQAFGSFVKRQTYFTGVAVFFGGVIALCVYAAFLPPLTPKERQALEAEAAQRTAEADRLAAQRRDRDEHLRVLCKVKAACKRWAEVRQECATAGNFDTCVSIKLDQTAVLTDYCTSDGHMGDRSEEPSAFDCLFH